MGKRTLNQNQIAEIVKLRQKGETLPEIRRRTGRSNGTISKYIQSVEILPEYLESWKVKRGGSKARALRQWREAENHAQHRLVKLDDRDKFVILACLYWGEGNKRELNLINSDPSLVKVFVECLRLLGVSESEFRVSLRLYRGIDIHKAKFFWSDTLNIPVNTIKSIEFIHGKKKGKLEFGMCRVRVAKGGIYFKSIMSVIHFIKQEFMLP